MTPADMKITEYGPGDPATWPRGAGPERENLRAEAIEAEADRLFGLYMRDPARVSEAVTLSIPEMDQLALDIMSGANDDILDDIAQLRAAIGRALYQDAIDAAEATIDDAGDDGADDDNDVG